MWKVLISTIILAFAIKNKVINDCVERKEEVQKESKPKFIIDVLPTHNGTRGALESVSAVLKSLGYEMSSHNMKFEALPNDTMDYDFDVMWTWFHWKWFQNFNLKNLKIHQKIQNHPGTTNLIRKHYLATTTDSKYVLKGFLDPRELKKYAEANPTKRFVQKLTSNKGITLKNYKEIEFENRDNVGDGQPYFAQEFLENPLLIDGHMFDFGIYTLITSVNPLRVYYYTENCVLRFAKLPYNHSDFNNTDTYVIDYEKTRGVAFPPFHIYRDNSFSNFVALKSNLKRVGVDPDYIFEQVEDCISSVFSMKENNMIQGLRKRKAPFGSVNFFTLVRCDFVINKDGKLHLIEVNQSPNIGRQDGTYDRFRNMYRSMIKNVFDILGVGTNGYMSVYKNKDGDFGDLDYVVNDVHLSVSPEDCLSEECQNEDNCKLEKCQLCIQCLDDATANYLEFAYLEHMNMKNMKRAHPRSVVKFTFELIYFA